MKRENDEKTLVIQNMLSNLQWPAVSPSVTLEALQNTKVRAITFFISRECISRRFNGSVHIYRLLHIRVVVVV